ncbi:hypothetical protein GYH30_030790 [Glycine max]|uniref:Major facilitator superfamily (MFS) profile domain-containing protein n=1 Tax=Glycine max TaxID=3847 RepID=A0A0R0HGC8_SOYBN|nr:hypothetical protein GYH30_030790 [Glycine max]
MSEGKVVETEEARKTILDEDFDPPIKKPKRNTYAFACAMLATTTSILLGYDIGVMSGAAIYIKKDLKVSDVQIEILIGIFNLYSLIGSCLAGRTSDWIGRRYTIVFAGAIFFAGAILMGFSPNYAFLMFGRFVAGIGMGYGLMIAPVYTSEVSPASSRGFLTSFTDMTLKLGWRMMLGTGAIPSILLTVGVLAMPESPRWLVMRGRLGDATKVLKKTSDTKEEAELRLADIKQAAGIPESCNDDVVQVNKRSTGEGVWKELFLVLDWGGTRDGMAAGVDVNRTTSGIISMTFLSLSKAITIGGAFFLYCGIATFGWIFFYTVLPETRGKTLEEIEGSFGKFWVKSNTNKGEDNGNGQVPQLELGKINI